VASLAQYLDVGGISIAEAQGFAAIVAGTRSLQRHDDGLLQTVTPVLDSLHATYSLPERV
jgi:hypothetical protein